VSEASEMRFLMASILELQADEADHPSWNPPLPHGARESLFAAGRLSVTSTGTTSSPFKVETVQPTIVMNFMIKR
jgi:hypothetical protein